MSSVVLPAPLGPRIVRTFSRLERERDVPAHRQLAVADVEALALEHGVPAGVRPVGATGASRP